MHLKRLLNTPLGNFFISILFGLGLATLFRKVCKDRNCLIFKAPNINNIENKTYKYDDKCYTLKHKSVQHDDSKKDIFFA